MILTVEILAVFSTAILAIAWIGDPSGNYEPWTVLLGLISVGSEVLRRKTAGADSEKKQIDEISKDTESVEESKDNTKQTTLPNRVNSTAFFAERFGQAFPGVREIAWYSPTDSVKRLSKLFDPPFTYQGEDGSQTPIWWFRGGNMGIDNFRVIDQQMVLLDYKELKIKRLAAVPSSSYYRQFVYIEAEPMAPTGLYPSSDEKHESAIETFGYDWEEYGLYKGKYLVTRGQYDDNAAMIGGELVKLGNDVEIRSRYTSPYNLVIAPHGSPINNGEFDRELVRKLNEMLEEHTKISELQSMVERLPRHPHMYES
ncbi:MAG: hypothetical protein ABW166_02580 [Sedimenticola sp.]